MGTVAVNENVETRHCDRLFCLEKMACAVLGTFIHWHSSFHLVFTLRSGYMTPLVSLLCFLNSFLLSTGIAVFKDTYTSSFNINIFKSKKIFMSLFFFFSDLYISHLLLAQQLDFTTLFPRRVFKSLLKHTCCESSVAETITRITFHDPNEFTPIFSCEGKMNHFLAC